MPRPFVLGLLALLASSAPAAHHSVLRFDSTREVTLQGTVHEVLWRYPHVYLEVDVEAATSEARWTVESESPAVLERIGWSSGSVRAGDRVRIAGAAARDGSRLMRCDVVEPPDGSRLPCYPPGASATKDSRAAAGPGSTGTRLRSDR